MSVLGDVVRRGRANRGGVTDQVFKPGMSWQQQNDALQQADAEGVLPAARGPGIMGNLAKFGGSALLLGGLGSAAGAMGGAASGGAASGGATAGAAKGGGALSILGKLWGNREGIGDALGAAGDAYGTYRDQSRADDMYKRDTAEFNRTAPLREAGMRGLMDSTRQDLSGELPTPAIPRYRRVAVGSR